MERDVCAEGNVGSRDHSALRGTNGRITRRDILWLACGVGRAGRVYLQPRRLMLKDVRGVRAADIHPPTAGLPDKGNGCAGGKPAKNHPRLRLRGLNAESRKSKHDQETARRADCDDQKTLCMPE